MRIISKFHDYYDGGAIYGIDSSTLYLRNKEEIELKDRIIYRDDLGIIGFCGKLYPFYYKQITEKEMYISYDRTFIEKKEIETIYNYTTSKNEYKIVDRYRDKHTWYSGNSIYKDIWNEQSYKELFLKYKTPIFVIKYENRKETLTINSSLKEYKFFRNFNTTQTFQEIEMFISNDLANDMMKIPDRTNEEIGTSKGFDEYSFRNAKKKPKKF